MLLSTESSLQHREERTISLASAFTCLSTWVSVCMGRGQLVGRYSVFLPCGSQGLMQVVTLEGFLPLCHLTKAMKLSMEEITKHCGKIRRLEINKETCSWIWRLAVLQTPPEQFAIQLRFTDQKTEHPGHTSTSNPQIQLKFYPNLNEVLLWMESDKLILKFTKKINKQIILEKNTRQWGGEDLIYRLMRLSGIMEE